MKKIIFSLALFAATAAKANVIRVRRALLTGPIIQIEPADSEKKHPKVSEQIVIFNQIFDFLKKYPKFQTRTFNKEKFYLLNLMRLEVQKDAHKCSKSLNYWMTLSKNYLFVKFTKKRV